MKHAPIEKLPTDRAYLHFDAVRIAYNDVQVDYELVLPLTEADCRGTFDHKGKSRPKSFGRVWLDRQNNKRIPLGRTNVGSEHSDYPFHPFDGSIQLPFRDGAHAQWDNERLGGLPLIYSFNEKHYLLTKEPTP